eukprot:4746247-Alexandrium_andersonii.AAC.1
MQAPMHQIHAPMPPSAQAYACDILGDPVCSHAQDTPLAHTRASDHLHAGTTGKCAHRRREDADKLARGQVCMHV